MRHVLATSQDGVFNSRDNRGADFDTKGVSADTRPQRDGSFSREQLLRFIWDTRFEPNWRSDAELENAYYDNDQLTQATLMRMRENGIPPIVINMIAASIDNVAGLEMIIRSDPKILPEGDAAFEIAEGLNVKLKEAVRLTRFNPARGQAFKQKIKSGLGWLEVSRSPDPFEYPYRVEMGPWREFWTDYRSRKIDYSDQRFMMRAKWYDVDVLQGHFPKYRNEIRDAQDGYAEGWISEWESIGYTDVASQLTHASGQDLRFTLEEDEWRQQMRGRTRLFEILYKVPRRVECLVFMDGLVVELDKGDPMHLAALQRNMARYQRGTTHDWRQAYYVGPTRLHDRALAVNRPHYIPFVCYRRDADGAPYGLIRRMRSPQEAVNARYARMLYDLSSQKVFVDDDAVEDHDQTAREINKARAYVVMKPDRRGEQGITLVPPTDSTPIAFQLLQEAKQNIFDVTGLHPEFQGRAMAANRSGVAIEQLVEQVQQVLGEVFDRYRESSRMAAERLLDMIVADMAQHDNVPVEIEDMTDGRVRNVVLNARERPDQQRTNDILMIKREVAIGTTPSTATYQQQKFQSLVEIVKSMPEQLQAVMSDFIVRAAALPDGEMIMDRIRAVTGMGLPPRDPKKREMVEQEQQQQAALQERLQEIEMLLQEAEIAKTEAQAYRERALAEKIAGVDTELTSAKTDTERLNAGLSVEEQERKDRETEAKLIEASGRMIDSRTKAKEADKKPANAAT